jgi:hypothetical protein
MDGRGLDESALVTGARRSTMGELAASTLEADNVIVGALFVRRGVRSNLDSRRAARSEHGALWRAVST